MAGVFLSYDRDDTDRARPIALALEKAGHEVWWDLHVRGGAQFSKVIEEALKAADVVVVLWSANSIESAWVRDEAAAGRDSGRLVPATIDGTAPPLGFRQFQTIDLSGWKGRGKPVRMAELLASIEAFGEPASGETLPQQAPAESAPVQQRAGSRLPTWVLIGVAVLVIAIGSVIVLKSRNGTKDVYTLAVSAADPKAAHLAHDLLVSLGQLQSASSGSLQLVSDIDSPAKADLVFEVAADDHNAASASLVLRDEGNHSVLWSDHIDQPSGKVADLQQQLAYTAGRVLACTFDGLDARGGGLKPQTLKLFLTACAHVSEAANSDPIPLIKTMEKVLADSPRFEPAWGTLLLIQANAAEADPGDDPNVEVQRSKLRKLIADARKIDPNMPEATLAEISLVPVDGYAQALGLANKAVRDSQGSPDALSIRANLLRRVGRMREAIDDARQAALLAPLSPYSRNEYISALFYGGRMEAAQQELAKAEQLWPGTETVEDVRYRYHLRYGDPREALKIVQAEGKEQGIEQFLHARIDRNPGDIAALRDTINKRIAARGSSGLSYYLQAAGEFGWEDDLFKLLLNWPRARDLAGVSDIYFRPQMKKFRSDPRFMVIAKRAGLVDYWQKSRNWPDFCSDPDLPYDCKSEAAKLS